MQGIDGQAHAWRVTLFLGLAVITVASVFLFLDVLWRGGAIIPHEAPRPPASDVAAVARWISVSVTPICWIGVLLLLDGVLARLSRKGAACCENPVRERPRRLALCFLSSVPIWLAFDRINFAFLGAWEYHGLPDSVLHLYAGYFFAFGAILPAMFLLAQAYQCLGLWRLSGRRFAVPPVAEWAIVLAGLTSGAFTFLVADPVGAVTLWLAWLLLLDPLNRRLGAPSLLGDWRHGRWGRTVALAAAGATCGVLWELWNYWSAAKWTYNLPFLGPLETVRVFEMPLVGFLGFPVFALECWVIFQSVALFAARMRPRAIEPLPDDSALL